MNTCKTCRHWRATGDEPSAGVTHPIDPDTCEPMQMPFEVRSCKHPKLLFCERPLEPDGFAVQDGSYYAADLITAENFGCIQHEL